MAHFVKDLQFRKFCAYGFLKNLRFFDVFLLLFLLDLNMSYTLIGVLYASREFTINLGEIPSGVLADTYGRKRTLLVALISYILSFIIFFSVHLFYCCSSP